MTQNTVAPTAPTAATPVKTAASVWLLVTSAFAWFIGVRADSSPAATRSRKATNEPAPPLYCDAPRASKPIAPATPATATIVAAHAPMRKSTRRYPSDADLLMLAERFYAVG